MSDYRSRIILGAISAAGGVTIAAFSAVSLSAISNPATQNVINNRSTTEQVSSSDSGAGVINIYLTDAPAHDSDLKYLLVNVSSLVFRYRQRLCIPSPSSYPPHEYVYNVPPPVGTNVNLTSLQGTSAFLGAPSLPAAGKGDRYDIRDQECKSLFQGRELRAAQNRLWRKALDAGPL
jgi:hypothetical protein